MARRALADGVAALENSPRRRDARPEAAMDSLHSRRSPRGRPELVAAIIRGACMLQKVSAWLPGAAKARLAETLQLLWGVVFDEIDPTIEGAIRRRLRNHRRRNPDDVQEVYQWVVVALLEKKFENFDAN